MKNVKRWFKKDKQSISQQHEHPCPNCSYVFKGFYCPNCGQSTSEFDRPLGFIFYDFLGNFIAFDSRFYKTFGDLIFKPGFITREFFKGHRARYAPPFRVYIFMSFILFLLLQIMTNRGLNKALDYAIENDTVALAGPVLQPEMDSLNVELATAESSQKIGFALDLNELLKADNIRGSVHNLANQLENKAQQTDDPIEKKRFLKIVDTLRSPEQMISRFLKYLSYAFFVLLPIFALLLKLFYVRRKVYYIRHLVFSVHLHSFLFFILSVIIAFNLIFPTNIGVHALWLFLIIPIYIYIAQKNFYKQGYLKAFTKFLLIGLIYNFLLMVSLVSVFINALGVL